MIAFMSHVKLLGNQRTSTRQANMDDEGENEFVGEQVNEIVKTDPWLNSFAPPCHKSAIEACDVQTGPA